MSNSRKIVPVARMVSRYMSKGSESVQEVPSPRFARLKQLQKQYTIQDGTPVFLKGGFGDRVLYLSTVGLVVGGFGFTLKAWYELTFKGA